MFVINVVLQKKVSMKNFKIEEALARAKDNGARIFKTDIAAKLWPESNIDTQRMNMSNLCNGRSTRIKPEWALIICDMCGCTLDFLFGKDDEK